MFMSSLMIEMSYWSLCKYVLYNEKALQMYISQRTTAVNQSYFLAKFSEENIKL